MQPKDKSAPNVTYEVALTTGTPNVLVAKQTYAFDWDHLLKGGEYKSVSDAVTMLGKSHEALLKLYEESQAFQLSPGEGSKFFPYRFDAPVYHLEGMMQGQPVGAASSESDFSLEIEGASAFPASVTDFNMGLHDLQSEIFSGRNPVETPDDAPATAPTRLRDWPEHKRREPYEL